MRFFIFLCGWSTWATLAVAQAGSWPPAGADSTYPRTLLRGASLPAVRASLAAPVAAGLYAGLYAETSGPPPGDNSSTSGRRARATFAKNAAFVRLLNCRPGADRAALAPAERDSLQARVLRLLAQVNTQVEPFITPPATASYDQWQWRSKELMDYLTAYDLLRGAGVPAPALAAGQQQLQAFAGNLQRAATAPYLNVAGFTFFAQIKNNHALMTAAALGLAAVVLSDASSTDVAQQPSAWLQTGLYYLDNTLWEDARRQSDPQALAGYAEGPYYFKYAFLNCLPFFRALGHFLPDTTLACTVGGSTRLIRHPYHDPRYDRLYEWISSIMMPDGRFPALEDSYIDMGMPELALTGKPQYLRPLALSKLEPGQLNTLTQQLRDLTVDMRAAYLAANQQPVAPAPGPLLTALPASGNLVFRSGPDSLATYLHLYGKSGPALTNSGGHSQADASSFVLHAYGQLLAFDPGYLSYTNRAQVGQASNHNLLLVDDAGPAMGTAGSPNDAAATVQNPLQTPGLAYGEVQTAYQGARILRQALAVRGHYFVLADAATAATPHTYTWQLHGYGTADNPTAGTGTFVSRFETEEGLWQKNGVSLLAHVTTPAPASGGSTSYAAAARPHELRYDTPEQHTALLVAHSGEAQARFLSVLYPFRGEAPRVRSRRQPGLAVLSVAGPDYHDLLLSQPTTTLATVPDSLLDAPLRTDGQLVLYATTATGEFAQLLVQQGTVLRYGPTEVLRAADPATVAWERRPDDRYAGAVDRATTLTLALPRAPQLVQGPGLAQFAYDAAAGQLTLVLSAATTFEVQLAGAPLPVVLTQLTASRQAGAVQLAWHTALDTEGAGFEVQRATAAGAFATLGRVASQGRAAAYAFRDSLAPAGATYYRLRLLAAAGPASYSPVRSVPALPAATPTLEAWPVPARAELQLRYTGPAARLRVLNGLGQQVASLPAGAAPGLDVRGWPPGLYLVQALAPDGRCLSARPVLVQP